MTAYLDQMGVTLRPASIDAVGLALRGLAVYVTSEHQLRQVRSVQRRHIECEGYIVPEKSVDTMWTRSHFDGLTIMHCSSSIASELGKQWSRVRGSNSPPHDYKSSALPTELTRRTSRV